MSWDKSQLPTSSVCGRVGQLSGAHRIPLFLTLFTLVASEPELLGLNDSHMFAASLENFLGLFVNPLQPPSRV